MWHSGRPDEPWNDELEQLLADEREAWRGDEHLAEWPEASAGPEYWMYKGVTRET